MDTFIILFGFIIPFIAVLYKRDENGDKTLSYKHCFAVGVLFLLFGFLFVIVFEGIDYLDDFFLLRTTGVSGKTIPFGYGILVCGIILYMKKIIYKIRFLSK